MPLYSYEAMDNAGVLRKDTGAFPSVGAMYESLRAEGLTLVNYGHASLSSRLAGRRRLNRLAKAELLRNISIMLAGGIPLRQALTDIAGTPGDPALRLLVKRILRGIDAGNPLSETMDGLKGVFPSIVVSLVRIGEETGRLDKTLEDGARHIEKVEHIVSSTRRALVYPSVVLVAMSGALAFWMIVVLPQVLGLFKDMGITSLPLATRLLMGFSSFCRQWWFVAPLLIIAISGLAVVSRRNRRLKNFLGTCIERTPVIGNVIRSASLAFFFDNLALLVGAGIQFQKALELMETSTGSERMKNAIRKIRDGIASGQQISEAFMSTKFFEPFVIRMISVGEQTGALSRQLLALGEHSMKRVDQLVESTARMIEPILLVFAGLIMVLMAIGLLGPIYDLMGSIK